MYQRLSAVLFPIMTLLLIGVVYWGYQEHQDKNSVLIKAENQYQRAFHDLTFHVNQLHQQLGNTLAVNSASQGYHRKGLVNVWRLTSQAQNEINQLPLTMLPFNKTEDFLSRISNFAYKTAVRDLTKQPLSDGEYKTMQTLYAKSEEISTDLQSMQSKVLGNNLRWMDVELAIASEKSQTDNSIIDGFKTVDKKVGEYPEINWGPSVAAMYEKRSINMLGGKPASPNEVKQKAAQFLGINQPESIHVQENGKGTKYASYTASVNASGDDGGINMDFTKRGGKLIRFVNPRPIGTPKLDIDKANANAAAFLKQKGFPEMASVNFDRYDNAVSLTFVGIQNDVLIYPEKLTVKVALDNGEVVGLQAREFVYEQKKRTIPKAKLTKEQARKILNPSFKVQNQRMALIDNDMGEEVLCYEYKGKINGGVYSIFVNADNGAEEKIERLDIKS